MSSWRTVSPPNPESNTPIEGLRSEGFIFRIHDKGNHAPSLEREWFGEMQSSSALAGSGPSGGAVDAPSAYGGHQFYGLQCSGHDRGHDIPQHYWSLLAHQ